MGHPAWPSQQLWRDPPAWLPHVCPPTLHSGSPVVDTHDARCVAATVAVAMMCRRGWVPTHLQGEAVQVPPTYHTAPRAPASAAWASTARRVQAWPSLKWGASDTHASIVAEFVCPTWGEEAHSAPGVPHIHAAPQPPPFACRGVGAGDTAWIVALPVRDVKRDHAGELMYQAAERGVGTLVLLCTEGDPSAHTTRTIDATATTNQAIVCDGMRPVRVEAWGTSALQQPVWRHKLVPAHVPLTGDQAAQACAHLGLPSPVQCVRSEALPRMRVGEDAQARCLGIQRGCMVVVHDTAAGGVGGYEYRMVY